MQLAQHSITLHGCCTCDVHAHCRCKHGDVVSGAVLRGHEVCMINEVLVSPCMTYAQPPPASPLPTLVCSPSTIHCTRVLSRVRLLCARWSRVCTAYTKCSTTVRTVHGVFADNLVGFGFWQSVSYVVAISVDEKAIFWENKGTKMMVP